MNYSKYKLSELFDKIDKLLQSYFGKEDDYNFYEKDNFEHKTDLSKKSYLMFLSNGDRIRVKIPKTSIPHLLGINTEYLKSTGLYKGMNSYEIMLDFIKNSNEAFQKHESGIINLDKILSPYIDKKLDSLTENLNINTNCCEMICKYDRGKTYGYSADFDDMSYLILQKKNEKYYVLKLAMSEDGTCFPMSNQVFNSYEECQEALSSYLIYQELTLLNNLFIYYNNSTVGKFPILERDRKQKLEKLKKLSEDFECTPNIIADFIYFLKIRDNKRQGNIRTSNIIEILCDCIKNKKVFDISLTNVDQEDILKIIETYNDSLFSEITASTDNSYSDLQNENISLKKEIERLRLENKSLSETVNYRDEELNEVKTQNNELREDINKVKGIISKY
ncbi:MAG: hypothetical protein ACI4UZ_03315 [Candidatus Aphodocola sp.]